MIRLWTVVSVIRNSFPGLSLPTRAKGTLANPVEAKSPGKIWFGAILIFAIVTPSVGFSDQLDETVSPNGHFANAVHLDFAAHETKAFNMSSNTAGEEFDAGKREKGRTISVTAREDGLWGAFVYAVHQKDYHLPANFTYAVSWNFPSEKEALNAAINKCSQTIGIPCWPRRKVYGWWLPEYVFTFSTSAKKELRVWPFDTKHGTYRFGDRIEARCIVIYQEPPNTGYYTLVAKSKDEATVKFREEQKRQLEYYGYKYPPIVLVEKRCNKR